MEPGSTLPSLGAVSALAVNGLISERSGRVSIPSAGAAQGGHCQQRLGRPQTSLPVTRSETRAAASQPKDVSALPCQPPNPSLAGFQPRSLHAPGPGLQKAKAGGEPGCSGDLGEPASSRVLTRRRQGMQSAGTPAIPPCSAQPGGRGVGLYIAVNTGHASQGVCHPDAAEPLCSPCFAAAAGSAPPRARRSESDPAPRGSRGCPSPSPCAVGLAAPCTSRGGPRGLLPRWQAASAGRGKASFSLCQPESPSLVSRGRSDPGVACTYAALCL